jgi:anti-anti-sigma factor
VTIPPPFRVGTTRLDGTLVVAPEGEIDISTAPALRDTLARAGPDVRQLVLDLRAVDFMDTSGLQIVVEQLRECDSGGRGFAIVRGTAPVQRLLDVAGLTPRLHLVDTPEDAVNGGGAQP